MDSPSIAKGKIEMVKDLFLLEEDDATTLLKFYNYNVDIIGDVFGQKGREFLLSQAGLIIPDQRITPLPLTPKPLLIVDLDDSKGKQTGSKEIPNSQRESLSQLEDLGQIMNLLNLRESQARTLLEYYNWDIGRLFGVLIIYGRDYLLCGAGIELMSQMPSDMQQVFCGKCLQNDRAQIMTNMACAHIFCDECWKEHFLMKMKEKNKDISCLYDGCEEMCDHEMIRALLRAKDPSWVKKFDKIVMSQNLSSIVTQRRRTFENWVKYNARILHIRNLPETNKEELAAFLEQCLAAIKGIEAPDHGLMHVMVDDKRSRAVVEMRSIYETTNLSAVDGISFKGKNLKFKRPKSYNERDAAEFGQCCPTTKVQLAATSLVRELSGSIFIGGLPSDYSEQQIINLFGLLGAVRDVKVMRNENGVSKGFGFLRYQDIAITDQACDFFNGYQLRRRRLKVHRAR